MVKGRAPLFLTVVVTGLLGAALLLVQPYSANWPGTAYTQAVQRYIQAALQEDSTGLARLSVSSPPVVWALSAARADRGHLALWQHGVQAWTGERRGDTAEVFVYPPGDECAQAPIVFRMVGAGARIKVLEASSTCVGR
jgi:hypothetical protein